MDFRARILLSVDDMIHSKQNWQNPKSKILNSKPQRRHPMLFLTPSIIIPSAYHHPALAWRDSQGFL